MQTSQRFKCQISLDLMHEQVIVLICSVYVRIEQIAICYIINIAKYYSINPFIIKNH